MVAARFSIVHAPASNDRELANTASKNGGPVGPINRKRTLSASSSPPVTQRADRRPQKITYRQKNQYCPVVIANQLDRTLGDPHIAKLIQAKNLPLLRILSALISEEGKDNENDDTESNDYQTMSMDNELLIEIQSIRLCPELMVGAIFSNTLVGSGHGLKQVIFLQKVDDEIDGLISDFENKYHEQVSSKTSVIDKLLKTATEAKTLQEKESKQDSVDKHTVLAYQNYMSCYGPKALGGKSAGTKLMKKQALATVKQTLEQCHEFETTGKAASPIMNLVNVVLN
nr:hypothetical protein [Tanacetum cinerariifolium]